VHLCVRDRKIARKRERERERGPSPGLEQKKERRCVCVCVCVIVCVCMYRYDIFPRMSLFVPQKDRVMEYIQTNLVPPTDDLCDMYELSASHTFCVFV